MNCQQARTHIETGKPDADAERKLLAHLRECGECRAFAEDVRLARLLRSLPVREPSPGFESRALNNALAAIPTARRTGTLAWPLALAASVALAVVATLQLGVPGRDVPALHAEVPMQVFTVTARPAETRIVDVVLDSKHALQDATLTVALGDNLVLENRPQTRELRWQTDVKAGGNKLSLPVQLINAREGEITVTLEHGDTRRQMKIQVREEEASAHSFPGASI